MSASKPLPEITPLDRPYWDHARRHELRLQRCGACRAFRFPVSPLCPECGSDEQSWERLSGRGKVISWVVFHRSYFPSFEADIPYNVAMIELEEGPVTITNLTEVANSEIRLGMPVEVVFEDVARDLSIPKFKPAAR